MNRYKINELSWMSDKGKQNIFVCELTFDKYNNFKEDLIIEKTPPDYKLDIVKKYYQKYSKFNSYSLNNFREKDFKLVKDRWLLYRPDLKYSDIYIDSILNLLLNDIKKMNKISLIDLTYTCEYFNYINNRMKNIIEKFDLFFNKRSENFILNIITSPKYNKIRKNESMGGDNYYYKEIL